MRKLKKVRALAQGYAARSKWLHWGLNSVLADAPCQAMWGLHGHEKGRLQLGIQLVGLLFHNSNVDF